MALSASPSLEASISEIFVVLCVSACDVPPEERLSRFAPIGPHPQRGSVRVSSSRSLRLVRQQSAKRAIAISVNVPYAAAPVISFGALVSAVSLKKDNQIGALLHELSYSCADHDRYHQ